MLDFGYLYVTAWLRNDVAILKPKQREAVFRAIADPTRREILGLLRHRKHTVGELAGNFRTSRPAISKHLRLLRRVGLVVTKNEGTARICQLNAEPLRAVDDWLVRQHVQSTRSFKKSLSRLLPHEFSKHWSPLVCRDVQWRLHNAACGGDINEAVIPLRVGIAVVTGVELAAMTCEAFFLGRWEAASSYQTRLICF